MKNNIIILTIFFTLIGIALLGFINPNKIFSPSKGNSEQKDFQKAWRLINNYQYDAAVPFLIKSIKKNPNFLLAKNYFARTLYFSGEFDKAFALWKELINDNYFDMGINTHLQNVDYGFPYEKILKEPEYIFQNELPIKRNFRFQKPIFIQNFHKNYILLLAQDKLNNGNILIIDSNNEYKKNYKQIKNSKIGLLSNATVVNNTIWITDIKKDIIHRIYIDDNFKIKYLNQLGKTGQNPLEFYGPMGICSLKEKIFINRTVLRVFLKQKKY